MNQTTEKSRSTWDVFLSYTETDRPIAALLSEALRDQGISVWTADEMPLGSELLSEVRSAIGNSRVLATIVGKGSAKSNWWTSELAFAIAAREHGSGPHVVPIILERDAEVPFFLRQYRGINASDPEELRSAAHHLASVARMGPRSDALPDSLRALRDAKEALQAEMAAYEAAWAARARVLRMTVAAVLSFTLAVAGLALLRDALDRPNIITVLISLMSVALAGLAGWVARGLVISGSKKAWPSND